MATPPTENNPAPTVTPPAAPGEPPEAHAASSIAMSRTEHRNSRVWLFGCLCLAVLAVPAIGYWPSTVAFATAHPIASSTSVVSFIICLAYATELSSIPLSIRHTAIPLLTIMLLITGTFDGLFLPLIIVALISATWTARSLPIGAISAGGALAVIPAIRAILGDEPRRLRTMLESSVPGDAMLDYLIGHWIVPLVVLAFVIVAIRFLCDILIFVATGTPVRAALQEFSVTRTTGLAAADLGAAILAIWIPAIFEFSFDLTDILNVHTLFMSLLDVYALGLMSFYTVRRLTRLRNSLHSITAITDALPLPRDKPDGVIVSIINKTLPNVRCFVCEPHHLPNRLFHTYRMSQPIGSTRNPRLIVFERSMLNRPFMTADGEVLASAASILSEELRTHREVTMLRTESATDPLTGAYTYASLISYLKSLQTENKANTIAIIYLELERFRHVNEHYGRRAGNIVLRTTASRIRTLMPEGSSLVRVGGDGFVILLPNEPDASDLSTLASKLHDGTSMPLHVDHSIVSISTLTSTAVLAPSNFSQLTSILENTGVEIEEDYEDSPEDTEKSEMPSEALRDAIMNRSFTLRYRPVFDLKSDKIIGISAMPHIVDADGNVLHHDFIVNEASRLALGSELTMGIIDQGVGFLVQLQSTVPGLTDLGIVLTGSELDDPAFYEQIENTSMRNPGITLHLQFGRDAMQQASSLPDFTEDLLSLGTLPNVHIAVVDAGTSFSELAALSTIPADSVVFDASVAQNLDDPRTFTIVKEMAAAAARHDFELFFSGVSQPSQVAKLRELGCTKVLGDVLATEMTASELRMRLVTTGISANLEYALSAGGGNGGDNGTGTGPTAGLPNRPDRQNQPDAQTAQTEQAAQTAQTAQPMQPMQKGTSQRGRHYEVPEIRPITRPSFDE